ncbi:ribokinase family protein [Geoglobus ahangari]|uniref:Ribokinase family protein n=1 Tax=Geoglobus ahangari TaxID=113653 RepID=A0A0F7IDW8_9EURY|nr:carbohydrate kinase family protein [Geoglobus ahangari]AKG91708.1 ribokinase family protein [Geoglobus ahangari]
MISGVGPALVDRICLIDDFPPRGGQAIVRRSEKHAGGAAGNVIYGLSLFGVRTRFFSTIGDDEDGEFYRTEMERAGVECVFEVLECETGRVDVYVDRHGERTFFVFPNAAGRFYPYLRDEHYSWGEYFYLDPFPFEGSLNAHITIAERAKEHGKTVVLNPGYPYSKLGLEALSPLLKNTDIVFLSRDEYEMLRGIEQMVELTVITLGKEGSMAIRNGERTRVPALECEVVDTTGAGDAFAAGFLYAMMSGHGLEVCLAAGNFTACHNIQRLGARNFPKKEDLDEFIESYPK